MSLHEKGRNKKMPTPRHKVTQNEGGCRDVGNWYLSSGDGLANITGAKGDMIGRERGWASDEVTNGTGLLVRLWRRESESPAEGWFTCDIPGDTHTLLE